ncbi:uncharacterized protein GVI51_H07051 [Nakaseomyces glabratus]|uniref:Central kinetochore subunit MCM21 n=1 Tax=Candida glabrata (strain ATCC 2001 / BCRC 20586 / JCM 3761 / NBRC 0622 / NRRL Y-65 / CBS 138) TaxID=284593 RepID=Q6FRN7_CANGA|nr:uncharacterized protein CAGL0H07139g [Nakaseomyces glabratus]KAH7601538.1 Cenp-O kinetochore centromere component [Nakaseomyces glabratus]KAH7605918.1 Cenp-O kinetochore centromere component [Nakaseomyces glabratus]QHS66751.1 uncharacterized protein GVI51_H07051 [Nakaseomyces glabratus]CAG60040.1 unnamed protein product [Nakaseomyces glabratus]|eukprot:XP_447107.1 uncharacterized protein CAGL0H07139g [[Candida] glabrata]
MDTVTVEELLQDVEALTSEINGLQEKSKKLREQLKHPEQFIKFDKAFGDFNDIFEKNPGLRDLLLGYEIDKSATDVDDTNIIPVTPQKKSRSSVVNEKLHSLPEHEWVLKTQPLVEHRLFDESVRDVIDTDILISPSKRKQKIQQLNPNSTGKVSKEPIQYENIYRLFGISYFPLVDPSDLIFDSKTEKMIVTRDMLGIRFDIFNESSKSFEKPHYILLKKSAKSDDWKLFKYTVPNYIDVEGIFAEVTGGLIRTYDDVYLFAKCIYLLLVEIVIRSELFLQLEKDGIIDDLDMDLQSLVIKCTLQGTTKIEFHIHQYSIIACTIKSKIMSDDEKERLAMMLQGSLHDLKYKLISLRN